MAELTVGILILMVALLIAARILCEIDGGTEE